MKVADKGREICEALMASLNQPYNGLGGFMNAGISHHKEIKTYGFKKTVRGFKNVGGGSRWEVQISKGVYINSYRWEDAISFALSPLSGTWGTQEREAK